jgi:hypothetical protein
MMPYRPGSVERITIGLQGRPTLHSRACPALCNQRIADALGIQDAELELGDEDDDDTGQAAEPVR